MYFINSDCGCVINFKTIQLTFVGRIGHGAILPGYKGQKWLDLEMALTSASLVSVLFSDSTIQPKVLSKNHI